MTQDAVLRDRARAVIPGGLWGHMRAAGLPAGYPQFFRSGQGCRVTDVDGRPFIDYMCSWGPIVLGHHHPEVEAAAARQRALGDLLNGPTEVMVRLAEALTRLVTHADWVMFSKNGADATTTCVSLARAATGRRKILLARRAYHGALPWCSPYPLGSTPEDRAHLIPFDYNDVDSLHAAAELAGKDLAGVLVSAFRHDYGQHQEMARPEFAQAARALCDATDAALILDDVRAGWRLSLHGSWDPLGVQPDLSAWSKAIANGHALAAVTGREKFRDAASQLYVTGSFWCAAVPMAAALVTLEVLEREAGPQRMQALGQRLREGLAAQAGKVGLAIRQSGPPQMPSLLFEDDPDFARGERFCSEALKRGVYLHPRHNMFLSLAHHEAAIEETLQATEGAFEALARHLD
jgi:glutamate-1-semialdehyde 2,1-aminomutase